MDKNENLHTAPDGYLYHKEGRYIRAVQLPPSKSINEYELITIEEYEAVMKSQEGANEERSNNG